MTTTDIQAIDGGKLEAFVGQAVVDMGAAISGLLLHIGDRLGLYKAMAGAGPITPAHQRVGHREQVDVPNAVGEPAGHVRGDTQGQSCLAHPARSDGCDQALLVQRCGQGGPFGRSADERRQRHRQLGAGQARRCGLCGRGERGQRAAVSHLEFSQQGGDVTLHSADRDEQSTADFGIGQVLTERGQYLGLPG